MWTVYVKADELVGCIVLHADTEGSIQTLFILFFNCRMNLLAWPEAQTGSRCSRSRRYMIYFMYITTLHGGVCMGGNIGCLCLMVTCSLSLVSSPAINLLVSTLMIKIQIKDTTLARDSTKNVKSGIIWRQIDQKYVFGNLFKYLCDEQFWSNFIYLQYCQFHSLIWTLLMITLHNIPLLLGCTQHQGIQLAKLCRTPTWQQPTPDVEPLTCTGAQANLDYGGWFCASPGAPCCVLKALYPLFACTRTQPSPLNPKP